MKKLMMIGMIAALAVPVLAYDSLEALVKDFTKKQADALKTYVTEHPQAEDIKKAESMLTQALAMSGQSDEAIALLEKKYERLVANKENTDVADLLRGCILPILATEFEAGQKDKAKAFMDRVEKDWATDSNATQILRTVKQYRTRLITPVVGDTMDFKVQALDGKEIDVAAMKGKVVLVDFWATWCGPCLQELPNVKKAYAAYHDKGFEIIGISLDDDKAKLEAFLKKDTDVSWPQSCSGEGWNDPTSRKYGITGIPAMFLIGKDGKIAAVSPRGPGVLEKKLEDLLAK